MPISGLSVSAAAQALGVHPQRVHQRIREGSLRAEKIGNQWVVDPADLSRLRGNTSPGRPLSHRSAWALLAAAGAASDPLAARDLEVLGHVDAPTRSRARARLRGLLDDVADLYEASDLDRLSHLLQRALSGRADRVLYVASPVDLSDLADDGRLHLSGVSIQNSNLSNSDRVEGYLLAEDHEQVVNGYLLTLAPPERANVFFHVADFSDTEHTIRRERLVQLAPSALAVAADLAEHDGVREKSEAARILLTALGGREDD